MSPNCLPPTNIKTNFGSLCMFQVHKVLMSISSFSSTVAFLETLKGKQLQKLINKILKMDGIHVSFRVVISHHFQGFK